MNVRNWLKDIRQGTARRLIGFVPSSLNKFERLIAEGRSAECDGQIQDAVALYRTAIEVAPQRVEGYLNLAIALAALGDHDGAKSSYLAGLTIAPDDPFVNYNFANFLCGRDSFDQAETHLRRALGSRPSFPEALVALGNVLDSLDRKSEAREMFRIALSQRPDYLGALYNFSVISNQLRCYEDAEDAIREFLALDPDNLDATQVLALALWGQTRWAESLEQFQLLRKKVPWSLELESKELFLLNYDETISPEELFRRHCEYGRRLEEGNPVRFRNYNGAIDPARRLRLGYVSPDYNWHPVGLFILPIIQGHRRTDFDVYCYYTSDKWDEVTIAVQQVTDHWVDVSKLTDEQLATKIHNDDVDILIDLTGHTSISRLAVFAQKPAPVQVTWMGYLNTTGLTTIDYRICDSRTDPPGISDALHTESLVRLTNSQWCYRPEITEDIILPSPFEKNGYITFGSFNHTLKISEKICSLWAEILLQLPNSRLLCVGITSARKMGELYSQLTLSGVDAERIKVVARTNLPDYFRLFGEVDIALDTFPYGGGTTTFDALWMGVPVVTSIGATPTSRSAASILGALGLEEWIAPTIDDYVCTAIARATHADNLAALRRSLRTRMQASPLTNESFFICELEGLYRKMWAKWCSPSEESISQKRSDCGKRLV